MVIDGLIDVPSVIQHRPEGTGWGGTGNRRARRKVRVGFPTAFGWVSRCRPLGWTPLLLARARVTRWSALDEDCGADRSGVLVLQSAPDLLEGLGVPPRYRHCDVVGAVDARIVEHGGDYLAPPPGITVARWHGRGRLTIAQVGDAVCGELLGLVDGVGTRASLGLVGHLRAFLKGWDTRRVAPGSSNNRWQGFGPAVAGWVGGSPGSGSPDPDRVELRAVCASSRRVISRVVGRAFPARYLSHAIKRQTGPGSAAMLPPDLTGRRRRPGPPMDASAGTLGPIPRALPPLPLRPSRQRSWRALPAVSGCPFHGR